MTALVYDASIMALWHRQMLKAVIVESEKPAKLFCCLLEIFEAKKAA
jgi:hypothetical protein